MFSSLGILTLRAKHHLPARLGLSVMLAFACGCGARASAAAYTTTVGDYTLRASTVNSTSIDARSAAEQGIEIDPRRAVLNVTLIHRQGNVGITIPADVHVTARDLTGIERTIPLHETIANNFVSYANTYDIVNNEVIDFTIVAKPLDGPQLTLKFRERVHTR